MNSSLLITTFLFINLMFSGITAFGRRVSKTNFRVAAKLKNISGGSVTTRFSLSMSTNEKASINVLVAVAEGSEEIEAVTIIDTLVRAGAKVTLASVSPTLQVTCSRGVKLVADKLIADCTSTDWDVICIPGGMPGAEHLRDCKQLQQMLVKQNTEGKLVSAICAAPAIVLQPLGILMGKRATCYPAPKFRAAMEKDLTSNDAVVVDGNIITSQGPGTSLKFSLALVEVLYGVEMQERLFKEMCADV